MNTTTQDTDIKVATTAGQDRAPGRFPLRKSIFAFIAELRRRQVCRTVAMYSVALWLVCQVVDVVSGPLDLPDWTLRFIIVIGLIGFPIALILSWLFELTREGVVPDSRSSEEAAARRPLDRVLDCALVIAATIIGIQLATGILSTEVSAAVPATQRMAVLPFKAANGDSAAEYSHSLVGELQHELTIAPGITVIAPREPYLTQDGLSLSGTVAVGSSRVRVTANMVDNDSGEIVWTSVFERTVGDDVQTMAELAIDIVAALSRHHEIAGTGK